jgi:hypothetical protein
MAEAAHKNPGPLNISNRTKGISAVLMFVGIAAFAVTLMTNKERAWHAYLAGYSFYFILAIGGLFFSAVNLVSKAGWVVNVRRFSEALTAFLPLAFAGALVLLLGGKSLYDWMNPDMVAADELLAHKAGYLNLTFFVVRMVLFFAAWLLFKHKLVGGSVEQDKTGDDSITHRSVGWGVAFLLVFALSFSLFGVDILMSLQAHWFSTIFGIYLFAGLFQSTMAAMILMIVYCMRKGLLKGYVDENHLHDLGKYLFAFTVFWAYIAYSQYMLIWYANLPEETVFFLPRVTGSWTYVTAGLLLFKFIVPFMALLPRWAKRSTVHLSAVSILILVMQYVDIYWLIYPNLGDGSLVFGLPEIGCFLGFTGAFVFVVSRFLGTYSIVPVKDPRQFESNHHHVVY